MPVSLRSALLLPAVLLSGCMADPRPYVLVQAPLDWSVVEVGADVEVLASVVPSPLCTETPTLTVYLGNQPQPDWTIDAENSVHHNVILTVTTDLRMTVAGCGYSDTARVHLCTTAADCGATVAADTDTDSGAVDPAEETTDDTGT